MLFEFESTNRGVDRLWQGVRLLECYFSMVRICRGVFLRIGLQLTHRVFYEGLLYILL